MKKLIAIATPTLLLVVLFLICISAKQPELPEQPQAVLLPQPSPIEDFYVPDSFKERLMDSIQAYFNNAVRKNQIVGASVAIVKCDSIIYADGFGSKNSRLKNKVDKETVFRIGSVSKGFAGILAGIHVQQGLISWKDRVIDHIPNFRLASKKQTNEVTLSHILSHTSGLPYHSFTNLVESGMPLETIAGRFNQVLPLQKPGSIYNYQNAVFALSGEIMERIHGKPLKDIIQDKIFDPLNMETASASYEELEKSGNVAQPHRPIRRGWRPVKYNKKYYSAVAAGGINASVVDMGKWMKFLLGNNPEVLMPKFMQEVFSPKIQVGGRRNYYQRWKGYESSHYALGWRVHNFVDNKTQVPYKVIHHGGTVNNFRSEIALFPHDDLGICVLFNSPNKMARNCIPEIYKMIQDILENPLPEKENSFIQESLVML
ncbi:beta-lactamase family protein [Aquimarina sp. D1M17]|uniref:serine hydrolase domain-containing protein n=1 Tax=Aquimarina acroporae TaxID=2937283 RepID=UPI0020C1772E|nr:serine hydrolase domain-containing protein [Aquimarina acroporae]MCK8522576.1 beta-lactamase family protein [Aquimarina acroporae]